MTTTTNPAGCRHCGIEYRAPHGRRWTAEAGWHTWTAPTDVERLERMRARRDERKAK